MSNEHNPIALLVSKIQQTWNSEISPHQDINLVRWIIKPEQSKLYEGFLKLESTPHGNIPDMLLVLLTPFSSIEHHSKQIISEWAKAYREYQATTNQSDEKKNTSNWDVDAFEQQLTDNSDSNNQLLVKMITSFQNSLPENRPFTLALFPYTVEDTKAYSKWLHSILKQGIPPNNRLMIFDHANERYFDYLCDKYEISSRSLAVPLDLEGAVSKLANSGDPNDPEIQFRQCILKMSKCVKNKNMTELQKWGEKGLLITQKTGIKSMYSTAHIIYAAMLFNFKEFELVDTLLMKGLALAKQGLKAGDDVCKSLIIQYYGFQASSKQLQKKYEEATNLFCKQADTANEIGYPQQSLNAWWMAYSSIKKLDKERYKLIVEKAYKNGIKLDKDTLKSTSMGFIAADYYNILDGTKESDTCLEINQFMFDLEGENWKADVETQRKALEKKKFSISGWF
ncbi:hypothetical protein [Hyunsoonleella rubra]|uniref:Uncharacterized protein n=1 Tax=Hyunsoonleella rubra TaxID=1737062 RepID=A0ABW5TAU7_9FLAO